MSVGLDKKIEHLPRLRMPTRFGFGVENLTVDRDIEHAFGPGCEGQRVNNVLVIGQEI